MKDKELSIDEQINIVKKVRKSFVVNYYQIGLCIYFKRVIDENFNISIIYYEIKDFIPLFNKNNAMLFDGCNYYYWWELNKHGNIKRLRFLDWILSELEKQKQHKIEKTWKIR